ncbi:MAG TPA: hydrogenase/urease maturation nickel metallochaperone HypA [Candidatus Bipolaricaulota bacterium]|nr:hydrogenase/urease maturation nickel metallochaperone HypA [Candidatus Bipolaricaulota bacterium]
MHDLHLADKIHKLVLEKAAENNCRKVSEISVELGFIREHGQDISPENLRFNLTMLNEGTLADGAEIKIEKATGKENYWSLLEIKGE